MAESTRAARSTKSRTGKKTGLSRESIVAAAVELANSEGTGALTLRRLGIVLGVDPTAFYRHFPDKDSLILAVGDHVTQWTLETAQASLASATTWQDQLRAIADASWKACHQFPGIRALTSARTTGQEAERAIVELLLSIVEPLGLDRRETVLTYRMIGDTVLALTGTHGAVLAMEPALQEKDETAWSRIYSAQRREEFPVTQRHLAELVSASNDDIFAFTIDTLIRGIEARTAPTV